MTSITLKLNEKVQKFSQSNGKLLHVYIHTRHFRNLMIFEYV